MKNTKFILFIVLILVVVGVSIVINKKSVKDDILIEGDYTVNVDDKLVLEDGQKLIVNGDLFVQGEISCSNGPLNIVVNGNASLENKLSCERVEDLPDDDAGLGISLVVKGDLEMSPSSVLETNGSIQFVENSELLAMSLEEVEKQFAEIESDTGDGNRIGPFIKKEEKESTETSQNETKNLITKMFGIEEVKAAGATNITISGQAWVNQPRRGKKQIVLFYFPNAQRITLQNFKVIGPDGHDGLADIGKSCNAKGTNGSDAMRFFAQAPNMVINNFELLLGHGGNGGDAETKKDCDPGKATGGEGGKTGNFKIIGSENFDISGALIVHPGWAGNGGDAIAYGKDGGPSENGGDAEAIGGDAEDNIKAIRAMGTVNGQNLIQIGSLYGGNGGDAIAIGGKGGDGPACKSQPGGDGGDATVEPGKGGDARVVLSGVGAGRTLKWEDVGGDAGKRDAQPGKGGNGSTCSPTKAGGDGGKGGDAILKDATAGVGADRNGKPTQTINSKGGDAGNGGDGCLPGKGGKGGIGIPNGADGVDGKNICPVEEKKEDGGVGKTGDDVKPEPASSVDGEPKTDPEPEVIPEPTGVCAPGEVLCNQCENACAPDHCFQNPTTGCYFCE